MPTTGQQASTEMQARNDIILHQAFQMAYIKVYRSKYGDQFKVQLIALWILQDVERKEKKEETAILGFLN